ncbi:tlde1 domain-containing protein [Rodentibacter caecimuris]|uniref:tlde1 domain-containing protein n=1 Tax=Rodentibacter caecimuris TaxID=1796644 RepID=UPI003AAC53A0
MWVDPLGLANCTYSIERHELACTSNDPNDRKIYKIDSNCIHSGRGDAKNKISEVNNKNDGPIWPGKFNMFRNTKDKHKGSDWYALQEVSWNKFSSLGYYLGIKRGGANLHLGTFSKGCITVSPQGKCKEEFDAMISFLDEEAKKGHENILEVIK